MIRLAIILTLIGAAFLPPRIRIVTNIPKTATCRSIQ